MSKRKIPKNITIGLDMFHYAVMTDEENETYDEPIHIPGLIQANISPIVNNVNLNADDSIYDTADAVAGWTVTVGLADLPYEDRANWLGGRIDANGVYHEPTIPSAKYLAIGYRREMSNSKYRYVWLYKGKFRPYDENADTKGETPTFQTPSITGTFMKRDKDKESKVEANEGDARYPQEVFDTWFDTVYEETPDVTPLTVTIDPLNEATGVDPTASVKWTFNKSLQESTINSGNFFLLDDGNANIAGTLDYNADRKVITFKPAENLTAGDYTAFATKGIKDISGKTLAEAKVTTFTV